MCSLAIDQTTQLVERIDRSGRLSTLVKVFQLQRRLKPLFNGTSSPIGGTNLLIRRFSPLLRRELEMRREPDVIRIHISRRNDVNARMFVFMETRCHWGQSCL